MSSELGFVTVTVHKREQRAVIGLTSWAYHLPKVNVNATPTKV